MHLFVVFVFTRVWQFNNFQVTKKRSKAYFESLFKSDSPTCFEKFETEFRDYIFTLKIITLTTNKKYRFMSCQHFLLQVPAVKSFNMSVYVMSWEIKGFSGLFWDCVNTVNDKQRSGNCWPSWGENCRDVCTAKLGQETIWQLQWHPAPVTVQADMTGIEILVSVNTWNGTRLEFVLNISSCHPHLSLFTSSPGLEP